MAQKAKSISISQIAAAARKAVKSVQDTNPGVNFTTDGSIAHVPYWILGIPAYDLEVAQLSQIDLISVAIGQEVQNTIDSAVTIEPAAYRSGKIWIMGYINPDPGIFLKD